MSKPWIGITTALDDGIQTIRRAYVEAVERAGGVPIVIPIFESEDRYRNLYPVSFEASCEFYPLK
jgi:gamma-glutamyl-gamma-aminobutyrate hydrolase PuuD